MKTIYLSASKISTITGDNRFESTREFIINIWKRYNYNSYIGVKNEFDNERRMAIQNKRIKKKVKKRLREENINFKIKNKSKEELIINIDKLEINKEEKDKLKKKIKKINNIDENKLECKKDVKKIITDNDVIKKAKIEKEVKVVSRNIKELNENKIKIIKKIEKMNIPEEEKEIIKKSIKSVTNKRYGTNREKVTVDYFMKKHNITVIIDKKKYIKHINTINNYNFNIVGEVDGIYEDCIIEIKNRTKRLFNTIYNYEKIQLYMYMFLLEKNKCILVEHFNDKLNELHLEYEDWYMNDILKKLHFFTEFYYKLLNNIEIQRILLLGSDADFSNIYNIN